MPTIKETFTDFRNKSRREREDAFWRRFFDAEKLLRENFPCIRMTNSGWKSRIVFLWDGLAIIQSSPIVLPIPTASELEDALDALLLAATGAETAMEQQLAVMQRLATEKPPANPEGA